MMHSHNVSILEKDDQCYPRMVQVEELWIPWHAEAPQGSASVAALLTSLGPTARGFPLLNHHLGEIGHVRSL